MILPTYTTEATDRLCREIAKKSHGVAFCMLSRGKDSVCAYLNLQRYFTRVIPFTCSLLPGYMYATEYLDYLEEAFNTRILRLIGEDLRMSLTRYAYQATPWDCAEIDRTFSDESYSKLDILDYLRMKFNLPRAWCAVGISKNDSIDRLIYCRKNNGKNDSHRTFYPCWDWTRGQLLEAIREAGMGISPEYRYCKRSMGGVPSATYNKVLMEHFPDDWKETLRWYPLAEAKNWREKMIDDNYALYKLQEAERRGGRTGEAEGESDSGADGGDVESEG